MLELSLQRRLDGFTLDVRFGAGREIVVLFGPSGAGKSLTLAMIAGIRRADAGRVVLDERVLFDAGRIDLPPQERSIGYVPQHGALFPHLSVVSNIGYGLRDSRERDARVAQLVETLGLRGLENRRPAELSGGQRQRVALARALAIRPRLLALDEPFAALDSPLRVSLQDELLRVHREWGGPILLVTHDPDEAFSLASRVVVLDEGRVLQEGGRDDIFERPASRRVAELVGVRNLLPARVLERGEGGAIVAWRGRRLLVQRDDLSSGTMVDLAIRSSRVLIVRADRPVPERNSFCGRIVEERLRAENYTLRFRIDGSDEPWDLEIDVPSYVYGRLGLAERKGVAVTLKAEDLHVIPQWHGVSAEPELTDP